MLWLNRLQIIQDELRNPEQVPAMVHHIRQEGDFSECKQLIEIALFPDGKAYIHNGHHRCVALFLAGREFLYDNEYYIKKWDYSDYDDIVFLNEDQSWRGYVTPFDIRKEARIANLAFHKKTVQTIYVEHGEQAAYNYIRSVRKLYTRPKNCFNITELANEHIRTFLVDEARIDDSKGFSIKEETLIRELVDSQLHSGNAV